MGVSKVNYGGNTLIDLTGDTVTADALLSGMTAHGANGEPIIGENPYEKTATDTEVNTQADWISQISFVLASKAGNVPTGTAETWTFTMEDGSTVSKVVYVDD